MIFDDQSHISEMNEHCCYEHQEPAEEQQNSNPQQNAKEPPQYIILPINRFSTQSSFEGFYIWGELFFDFSQRNRSDFSKESFWNQCKQWRAGQVDKASRLMVVDLVNMRKPQVDVINPQISRYLSYPDQSINSLFQAMPEYLSITTSLRLSQQSLCQSISSNPALQTQMFLRRCLFDSFILKYLSLLPKDDFFVAACIGPDLNSQSFAGYRTIMNEGFCEILGMSLEQTQELIARQGMFDYLDYESNVKVTEYVMRNTISAMSLRKSKRDQMNMENDCEDHSNDDDNNYLSTTPPAPLQVRFLTYDDLAFYADIQIQLITTKDLGCGDDSVIADHYLALLHVNISPNTLLQLITCRSKNEYCNFSDNRKLQEYTLLAEIFQDRMNPKKKNHHQMHKEDEKYNNCSSSNNENNIISSSDLNLQEMKNSKSLADSEFI